MRPVTVCGRDGSTCKISSASIPYERKPGGFSGNGKQEKVMTIGADFYNVFPLMGFEMEPFNQRLRFY